VTGPSPSSRPGRRCIGPEPGVQSRRAWHAGQRVMRGLSSVQAPFVADMIQVRRVSHSPGKQTDLGQHPRMRAQT
jgi:hypothetical protein